jgi:serine/threonine protein kinase
MVGTKGYIAPEVIGIYSPDDTDEIDDVNVSYTVAVDMWALGAIAFRLLTSQVPFSDPRSMFRYVTQKLPFPDRQLTKVGASTVCKEFLGLMMTPSPQRRPSATEAMEHPWMDESILSSELQSSTSPSRYKGELIRYENIANFMVAMFLARRKQQPNLTLIQVRCGLQLARKIP